MKTRAVPTPAALPPDNPTHILELRDVSMRYRVNGHHLQVLKGIHFTVGPGELICLVGRSGCGKSTLLKIIAGFMPPATGDILLKGRPITGPGTDRCVVFQEDALFPWLTVAENMAFGLRGPKKNIRKKVDRFLSLVDLDSFGSYLPREISGGMKQRVALARVLILEPEVLLMDEPFGALDAQTRIEMQDLLLRLWSELHHTILFVTHDVQEAITMGDRILLMGKDPGYIQEDIAVGLPRPRRSADQAFITLNHHLLGNLRQQADEVFIRPMADPDKDDME